MPIIAVGLTLASCAQPHQIRDRTDYLAEGTRNFPGETRERVIKAAETVLRLSDPKDFEFRYTLNGFTGLRRYFVYAVLASQSGREKWDFLAEQTPAGIQASVSISEAGVTSGGYSSTPYEGAMASVPLYRLFWSRVEYVLGRRNSWTTCGEAQEELETTKTNTAAGLGGLCGSTSDGRDAPAPPQMAPIILNEQKPRQPEKKKR
jgi:hypothetical protein